uniref:Uncharacterized protein n=1 Tax=Tetranychus urticae TaxID=32264 RepID=T1KJP8_TETUR
MAKSTCIHKQRSRNYGSLAHKAIDLLNGFTCPLKILKIGEENSSYKGQSSVSNFIKYIVIWLAPTAVNTDNHNIIGRKFKEFLKQVEIFSMFRLVVG